MITDTLREQIKEALKTLGIEGSEVELEHPAELSHGDYATNAAMKYAGEGAPLELAEKIVSLLNQAKDENLNFVDRIEVAGAGFINFYLSREFFAKSLEDIAIHGIDFGKNDIFEGKKVMVEHTDPNLFKEFHVGHLMNNTVGEAVAGLYESQGASVVRANYQSDVGPNIAKAVWGILANRSLMPDEDASLDKKVAFLGETYVAGVNAYEDNEEARRQIDEINSKIYERIDPEINKLYDWGREASIAHLEGIYKKLGSRFDHYFFESEVWREGVKVVQEGKEKGIFEFSDGAVVYRGEKKGLHTRVFINSLGLPTYETKELGLNIEKFKKENLDKSVVVTGSEQTEYFKVALAALEEIKPEIVSKTEHIVHGMLRTGQEKMSSRKGNVIGGGTLIEDVEARAREKIAESGRGLDDPNELARQEAVAAVKYAILKQTPGKDINFDMEKSLSLEGDSGPYLQYTYTRMASVLKKASTEGVEVSAKNHPTDPYKLERVLYRFPEIIYRSFNEHAPQQLVVYLTEVASMFNTFYSQEKIADSGDEYSPYKLALTRAARIVLQNGLSILAIEAPEKM